LGLCLLGCRFFGVERGWIVAVLPALASTLIAKRDTADIAPWAWHLMSTDETYTYGVAFALLAFGAGAVLGADSTSKNRSQD
jgi:hypothetical protein